MSADVPCRNEFQLSPRTGGHALLHTAESSAMVGEQNKIVVPDYMHLTGRNYQAFPLRKPHLRTKPRAGCTGDNRNGVVDARLPCLIGSVSMMPLPG